MPKKLIYDICEETQSIPAKKEKPKSHVCTLYMNLVVRSNGILDAEANKTIKNCFIFSLVVIRRENNGEKRNVAQSYSLANAWT